MKYSYTPTLLCSYRERPDAACRRPGWGRCSRCGRRADLTGGQKSAFRQPRFCDACLRRLAGEKGGAA